MSSRGEQLTDLLDRWENLHVCGPSDDPDEQTAVTASHRHLLIQIQRLAIPLLRGPDAADLKLIDIEMNDVFSVYNARAQIASLIPAIEDGLQQVADAGIWPGSSGWIVSQSVIDDLRQARSDELDTGFLVKICEEINSSFAVGNNVAAVLLMRAVLNYVPPAFGHDTFAQVIANSGRSLKDSLDVLENGLRKIADFHTHRRMGKGDRYPSAAQVEPFKPQFELLLQQVITRSSPG